MNNKLLKLNIVFAVVDTLICLVSILAFAYLALFFSRWWIGLFSIIPLIVYNAHTMIVDEDIRKANLNELDSGGDSDDR